MLRWSTKGDGGHTVPPEAPGQANDYFLSNEIRPITHISLLWISDISGVRMKARS
jgi:hypothetical protein